MLGRPIVLVLLALAAISGVTGYQYSDTLRRWINPGAISNFVLVSGNIEAHESVLSFKTVQSRIVELPFDEGQWVKAGTTLARVDDADYRQQVVIAEAALEAQRRQLAVAQQNVEADNRTVVSDAADMELKQLEFDRAQSLLGARCGHPGDPRSGERRLEAVRGGAGARQGARGLGQRSISLAEANVQSAEASLGMAKIVLGYATLTAPFDGVILVRQAELGEVTLPGAPVVTLADLDHVWLRAYINETDIGKVRYAETAEVTTDTYPGKIYKGRISFISSSAEFTPKSVETHAERVTLVYRIRIDIDNPTHELVPGMPADAKIVLSAAGS